MWRSKEVGVTWGEEQREATAATEGAGDSRRAGIKAAIPESWHIPQSVCDHQSSTYGKERCAKCPLGGGCFQPRALHEPIPLWVWILFGTAMALPLFWVLQPRKAKSWFYTAVSDDDVAAAWRQQWYTRIFQEIGLEHPERVSVFETNALDHCTALGTNTAGGAFVFIPRILAALSNPETELRIPDNDGNILFDGRVGQLTPELRADILDKTGVLLPDRDEISYVIGHEASHIFFNHAIKSCVAGGVTATAAHFLLKVYNRWSWACRASSPTFLFGPLTSKASHLAILTFATLLSSIFVAKYQERQADVHSATALHLKDPAIQLTLKKQRQNQYSHALGDYTKTAAGNNLTDWEHPSIEKQIEYLKKIDDAPAQPNHQNEETNEQNQANQSNKRKMIEKREDQ